MKLDQWLKEVYKEETEKTAAAGLETSFADMPIEEVLKIATESEKPSIEERAEKAAKKKEGKGREKEACGVKTAAQIDQEKLAWADALGRQVARADHEITKEAVVGPLFDVGNLGIPSGIGYALGKGEGRSMARGGEKMDRRSIAAALLVPGALGYRAGKTRGYKAALEGMKKGKEKKAQMDEEDAGGGMESTGDFTSPEAQAKAKVMSNAMKASKGAPAKVRKGAVAVAGKRLAKMG